MVTSIKVRVVSRIFAWDGCDWIQRGTHLDGSIPVDAFGHSLLCRRMGPSAVAPGDVPMTRLVATFGTRGVLNVSEWRRL